MAAVLELGDFRVLRDPSVGAPSLASVVLNQARVSEKELSWFAREFFAVSHCVLV